MALPGRQARNLRRMLGVFGAANGLAAIPGGSGKALEAWVLMRLALAARQTGQWRVSLRRGDGQPLSPGAVFALATFQAGIRPSSPSAPCYVLLEHWRAAHKRLELHGSLQWRGRSAATHEIDVSILPASIAEALRAHGGGLPRGLPILAVECKDKTTSGVPDEMRQTLARMFDLALVTRPPAPIGECRIYEDVTSQTWGRRSGVYRDFFAKGVFAIVRVGKFSSGAQRMADHYSIQKSAEVYDPSGAAILALEAALRKTLAGLNAL